MTPGAVLWRGTADDPAVELDHLTKSYGAMKAVRDVSLAIPRGGIFGLVGPNGAGKTTTVECIEGLRAPDSGAVRVLGKEPFGNRVELFRDVGVQLQEGSLHPRIRCIEAVRLFASFHRSHLDGDELLSAFGLEGRKKAYFGDLSAGQKRRMMVVLALIGDPKLVILDEPTTGLDPQARYNFWVYLHSACSQGRTVLLTTHYLEEAQEHCAEIALMDHGEIVLRGRPADLLRERGLGSRMIMSDPDESLRSKLDGASGISQVEVVDDRLVLYGDRDKLSEAVHRALGPEGTSRTLEVREATLQDLFLLTTGREYREE